MLCFWLLKSPPGEYRTAQEPRGSSNFRPDRKLRSTPSTNSFFPATQVNQHRALAFPLPRSRCPLPTQHPLRRTWRRLGLLPRSPGAAGWEVPSLGHGRGCDGTRAIRVPSSREGCVARRGVRRLQGRNRAWSAARSPLGSLAGDTPQQAPNPPLRSHAADPGTHREACLSQAGPSWGPRANVRPVPGQCLCLHPLTFFAHRPI